MLLGQRAWEFKETHRRTAPDGLVRATGKLVGVGVDLPLQIVIPDEHHLGRLLALSEADVPTGERQPRLFLVAEAKPGDGARLRQAGINFADMHGNMYLDVPGVLVDVRGVHSQKDAWPASIQNLNRTSGGFLDLGSPVRAQVIFVLVTWKELFDAPLREVASAAGTSLGAAQQVVGFLKARHEKLDAPAAAPLYKAWLAAYPERLSQKLKIANFESDSPRSLKGKDYLVSGESALPDLVRPATATIYVNKLEPGLIQENRWRKSSSPNIFVRRKFWREPAEVARSLGDPPSAPSTLVYADLVTPGDARLREVAHDFAQSDLQLRGLLS